MGWSDKVDHMETLGVHLSADEEKAIEEYLAATFPAPSAPALGASNALDGKALVAQKCTYCHGLAETQSSRYNLVGWSDKVDHMETLGVHLSAAEEKAIEEYLAATFAPATGTLDGKALVAQKCTICHALGRTESSKKNLVGWSDTIDHMETLGVHMSAAEEKAIEEYLAATFK